MVQGITLGQLHLPVNREQEKKQNKRRRIILLIIISVSPGDFSVDTLRFSFVCRNVCRNLRNLFNTGSCYWWVLWQQRNVRRQNSGHRKSSVGDTQAQTKFIGAGPKGFLCTQTKFSQTKCFGIGDTQTKFIDSGARNLQYIYSFYIDKIVWKQAGNNKQQCQQLCS